MLQKQIKELYWNNVNVIDKIEQIIHAVRRQNLHALRIQIPEVMPLLRNSINGIGICFSNLQSVGISWSLDYLVEILTGVEQAQNVEDFILMGDICELQLIPVLLEIQNAIRLLDIPLQDEDWLRDNLNVIEKRNPQLYHRIVGQEKSESKTECTDKYELEYTSIGCYTIALSEQNHRYYLHSNGNPIEEAREFANRFYCLEKERYLLFGWGLGYHVREMLQLYSDMDLVVVEPDLNLLYYAFQCNDWREELERVTIICDVERIAGLLNEGREMIVFQPELGHFSNPNIKEHLKCITERRDSIEDFEAVFYQNTRENIRNCDAYVDELQAAITKKRIIIVAGGPSLDKNIDLLRDLPEDVIVFAVGTVYKLLMSKGIQPNYVVVSDAFVSSQIQGMEQEEIPILILATADRRVSRCYNGKKYLVCQKGYKYAAEYAEKNGHVCYDSGGSVATLAFDIAIRMKAASIAFIGLDLAYYGNRAHASGTAQETYDGFEHHQVEGVNGERLNSSQAFIRYREWMERRIQKEDATMRIVDATEGGAKKKGFEVMTLKEFLEN